MQAKFAEILGGKAADYDKDAPLLDYGLDSLSSIEVCGLTGGLFSPYFNLISW